MLQTLLDAVKSEVSGDRALESVRALAGFHRVQASPGYREAASWLVSRLESYGLRAEVESVPGDGRTRYHGWLMPEGWECTRGVATLIAGTKREPLCDYHTSRLSLVLRSAPARGRFPLVALDDAEGKPLDPRPEVRGAIALSESAPHAAHESAVLEGGAAGIACDGRRLFPPVRERTHDPDSLPYTSFWWDESTLRGFGLVVSPRGGRELRARLGAGEKLEVEVEIESRFFTEEIPLVSALLPGRSRDEALVLAHLCHPQPSANDNASGAAAALECARALAALTERGKLGPLERGIRFLWMPEFTGTCAYLARHPGRAAHTVAALNLDMVGEDQTQTGSTLLVEHAPLLAASFAEELAARARTGSLEWIRSYSGPGHFSATRTAEVPFGGGSDHALLCDPEVGVPCPMVIQWPDRYYHSSYDTPDRCDPRSLALAARIAGVYAGFIAAAGEPQAEWLAQAVGRGARSRLLLALDHEDAPRRIERERLRAARAMRSLERLGLAGWRVEGELAALDRFCASELPADAGGGREAARTRNNTRIPRRRLPLPLPYPRHLVPGWERLSGAERRAWQQEVDAAPDAFLICDLAWYGCDGRRTVDEIAHLVWLETGRDQWRLIERFLDLTAALGLSAWVGEEAACKSGAPSTASR